MSLIVWGQLSKDKNHQLQVLCRPQENQGGPSLNWIARHVHFNLVIMLSAVPVTASLRSCWARCRAARFCDLVEGKQNNNSN